MIADRNDPAAVPGEPPAALVSALKRLLRPLVRALIAHRITYPLLAELLKGLYVDVAEKGFPLPGKRQTDSRINLLTGIHRKDIKRLRGRRERRYRPPPAVSLNAQMIGVWLGAAEYLDAEGRPKALLRHGGAGAGASFAALVETVSKDIRPRAVLDEWLRLGIARLDGDLVHLNVEAFVPKEGFDDLAYFFGRNLHDHIAASTHNLLGEDPPFVERSVHYDRLSAESVAALRRLAEEAGMQALRTVNRAALARAEADEGRADADRRINFGIYTFTQREPAAPDGGEDEEE